MDKVTDDMTDDMTDGGYDDMTDERLDLSMYGTWVETFGRGGDEQRDS